MATRRIRPTWLLLCYLGATTLLSAGCSGCRIGLHEGTRASVTQAFESCLKRGNTVVRFHLYLRDNATMEPVKYYQGQILSDSNFTLFRAKGNDTFAPYLWVWARANGKYILRVPMDFHVTSLGIISIYIADMEVPIVTDDLNCTEEIPYAEVQNMVATLLNDEIVHASDNGIIEDVICRSAYAMEYYIGRVIGVKGCDRNPTTGNFSCSSLAYMKGWEMTWFGPAAIITCFYVFIVLTIYKEYIDYQDIRGKDKNLRIKVSIIEQKILRDVKRIRRQIYGAPVEDNFIAYLDKVNFLDVLGVSQINQRKVVIAIQVIVSIVLVGGYYGVMGYSIYYHSLPRQRRLLGLIENSREMYANVFSHLAWLYTDESNVRLKSYALVEACFTGLMPVVMILIFSMFHAATMDVEVILRENKAKVAPNGVPQNNGTLEPAPNGVPQNNGTLEPAPNGVPQNNGTFEPAALQNNIHTVELGAKGTRDFNVIVRYASCYQAFANATATKIICVILGVVVIVFWLLIGGVYMIYSLYMIGVGSFLTANLFAGWMLPACLSIYYAYEVFTPLFELYSASKTTIFKEIHKRGYLVKTEEYMLAPTSIIEKFYYARSRGKVFEGFQRVFVALSILLMLFLIFIASQYPDFDIRSKNSNLVMGVNIAIILPFLASMVQTRQALSDFEKEMLSQDIRNHLDDWEAENEAMVAALKIRVQKLEKVAPQPNPFPEEVAPTDPEAPGTSAALPLEAAATLNTFDDAPEVALEAIMVVKPAKDAMDEVNEMDEITDTPESPSHPRQRSFSVMSNGKDMSPNHKTNHK